MNWLKSATRELIGLFMEDAAFTVALLVWLGVAVLLLPLLGLDPFWRAPVLFLGSALILVESAWRSARY